MNQDGLYGEYEPEIDIRDMLFHILYKWRPILGGAIIFCVLLSGLGILRRMSADPTIEPKKIRDYKLALAQYELDMARYELDMSDYRQRLEQHELYIEESVLMRINPYEMPRASADIFVRLDDAEWEILPDNITIDPTDSLIKLYASTLLSYIDWEPVETLTGGKEIYLKELISVSPDYNSNTFTVSVVYSDAETAGQILNIVIEQILNKYHDMAAGTSKHNLSVFNQSLSYSVDSSLADSQKANTELAAEYNRAILACQAAIEDLKEEEPSEPLTIGFIKYPAAGILGGGFLMVLFYGLGYLFGGKLHGDSELGNKYGYRLLGTLPVHPKAFLPGIDHILERLEGTPRCAGEEKIYQCIAANIKNLAGTGKKVLITGTADAEKIKRLTNAVAPRLKDITLTAAGDMNREAGTLDALAACDAVILAEEKSISAERAVQREHECINAMEKPVIGYILL